MPRPTSQKLLIEKLPNDYLLASMQLNDTAQQYVTSPQGKPLKFLNLAHVKEFFEGQRIDQVYMVDHEGASHEVERW